MSEQTDAKIALAADISQLIAPVPIEQALAAGCILSKNINFSL
jgi:hypothetical protein